MAYLPPDQTATSDWVTLASTISAAIAALAALSSVVYAQVTLAGARRDRQHAQLQRIAEFLVKIENAAQEPDRRWGQDRDFLRDALKLYGWEDKWESCVCLVHVKNPKGDTNEIRQAQVTAANNAARFAECALKEVNQTMNEKREVGTFTRIWRRVTRRRRDPAT